MSTEIKYVIIHRESGTPLKRGSVTRNGEWWVTYHELSDAVETYARDNKHRLKAEEISLIPEDANEYADYADWQEE